MVDRVRQYINQNIENGLNSKDPAKQLTAANAAMMLVKHDTEKKKLGLELSTEEVHTQALAIRAMTLVEPGKTDSKIDPMALAGLRTVAQLQQELSEYTNGQLKLAPHESLDLRRELAQRGDGHQMSAPLTPEEITYVEKLQLQLQNNIGIATAGLGAAPAAAAAAMGARPIVVNGLLNLGAGAEVGVEGFSLKMARGAYGGEPLSGTPLGWSPKGASQRGSVGSTPPSSGGHGEPLITGKPGNRQSAAGAPDGVGVIENQPHKPQAMTSSNTAGGASSSSGVQLPGGTLAPSPVDLKEVKLPPMQVTLADGSERVVPVNLLIREQDMLDPATGKSRNFDRMAEEIQPHLRAYFERRAANETAMNRQLEALIQLDVFVREPVVLNADSRFIGGQAFRGGGPELLILGHAANGRNRELSLMPTRAFMARGSLVPTEPGADLSIQSLKVRQFMEVRAELPREQETLTRLTNQLSSAPEMRGKQEKLALYQERFAHNKEIMQQLDARTKGYNYDSRDGAHNTMAEVRHGQRDGVDQSSYLPKPYQPHHELEYGLPVEMKTIHLPTAERSDIPVRLTLPSEMEQKYLKTMDGKDGILTEEAKHPFGKAIDLQALSQAVIEQVEQHGGTNSTPLPHIQKDTITKIDVIYLGTRRIVESPKSSSHSTSMFSDDRMLAVVHRAGAGGQELPPIVMSGSLHQKDSSSFQKQVEQGMLAADAPLALVLSRRTIQRINNDLGEELEILGKQSQWYATGDDPAPRHEASLRPPGPNQQQSGSYAKRYEEVKAALEEFNLQALRYRAPAEQSTKATPDIETLAPDAHVLDEALWAPQHEDQGLSM